jgi:two-component system sensor histidine kinase QseC
VSLQRRLLLYLLLSAPLVWAVAAGVSVQRARHEVNELFDTEIVRLAQQVHAAAGGMRAPGLAAPPAARAGDSDPRELAVAVWDKQGRLLWVDRENASLPYRPDATGFADVAIGGRPWRVYYLRSDDGQWLVAAGQQARERSEVVRALVASPLVPWLLVLPVLMLAMAWGVRHALAPVRALTGELTARHADDLRPLQAAQTPAELQPMLAAMNQLLARITSVLERERRFTADAAHELRTPLAVLRAQWDVSKRATGEAERRDAATQLDAGMDRIQRLVAQMLALSRLEAADAMRDAQAVDWPPIVEQVFSDLLPLAERRGMELACDWPPAGTAALPLRGNAPLLEVLLRNLLDNALRYGDAGSTVTLRFDAAQLAVENDCAALPEALRDDRLGERFHRADGQAESGSGLGVSIVQRIAALHGLKLSYRTRADGRGVVARLSA